MSTSSTTLLIIKIQHRQQLCFHLFFDSLCTSVRDNPTRSALGNNSTAKSLIGSHGKDIGSASSNNSYIIYPNCVTVTKILTSFGIFTTEWKTCCVSLVFVLSTVHPEGTVWRKQGSFVPFIDLLDVKCHCLRSSYHDYYYKTLQLHPLLLALCGETSQRPIRSPEVINQRVLEKVEMKRFFFVPFRCLVATLLSLMDMSRALARAAYMGTKNGKLKLYHRFQ